jgi:hypothetical protein
MRMYLPEDKKYVISEMRHRNELTFIYGGEGILSSVAVPPNVKYIFPISNKRLIDSNISDEV